MTAQRLSLVPFGGRPAVQSFQFTDFHRRALAGGPRVHEGRRAHQVIGNHPEPDPPSDAIGASIATAPQAVRRLITLMRPSQPTRQRCPRRNQRCRSCARRAEVLRPGRGKMTRRTPRAIAASSFAAEANPRSPAAMSGGRSNDRDVPIERGRPQRHVGRPPIMHLVRQ